MMLQTHRRAVQQTVSILTNKALGATDTVQLIRELETITIRHQTSWRT